jgi:formylmethanofuran dehydrogenase subunit E
LVKPPHSCFLDGVSVATGASMGKRNLQWTEAKDLTVRIKNTHTGVAVEVRPTETLLKLLASLPPASKEAAAADHTDHAGEQNAVEALARKIAAMPEKEIMTITVQPAK